MSAAAPEIHPDRLSRHDTRRDQRPNQPSGPNRRSSPPRRPSNASRRNSSPAAGRRRSGPPRFTQKKENAAPSAPIDREKVCPLLLRVFIKENGAFSPEDFDFDIAQLTPNEMQVYTWKDASLRELIEAIRSAKPSARRKSSKFEVSLAYPVPSGIEVRRVGSLHSGRAGSDDNLTLAGLRFETGDFLAVSIFT